MTSLIGVGLVVPECTSCVGFGTLAGGAGSGTGFCCYWAGGAGGCTGFCCYWAGGADGCTGFCCPWAGACSCCTGWAGGGGEAGGIAFTGCLHAIGGFGVGGPLSAIVAYAQISVTDIVKKILFLI